MTGHVDTYLQYNILNAELRTLLMYSKYFKIVYFRKLYFNNLNILYVIYISVPILIIKWKYIISVQGLASQLFI